MSTYAGGQEVWKYNFQYNRWEQVIGESIAYNGSVYVDMAYMRRLGSVNGYLRTFINETFHNQDPNLAGPTRLTGSARDSYNAEPPAIKAENDCTI